MDTLKNKKKTWIKPVVLGLSVKTLTLHGPSYAPNESIGSYSYSPRHKDIPNYHS
jgi:hypothetical protein